MKLFSGGRGMPRAPKPTHIPAQTWNRLLRAARCYPSPKQFYAEAVRICASIGLNEKNLIDMGIIEARHKPAVTETDIVFGAPNIPRPFIAPVTEHEPQEEIVSRDARPGEISLRQELHQVKEVEPEKEAGRAQQEKKD